MKDLLLPLNKLPLGKSARVKKLTASGNTRRRLLDLGVVNNTIIKSLHVSPSGDPTAYQICGAVIAMRSEEAVSILVEEIL